VLALARVGGYGSLTQSSDRVVGDKLATLTNDKALAGAVLRVPLFEIVEDGGTGSGSG
jgi:hypothetical protein